MSNVKANTEKLKRDKYTWLLTSSIHFKNRRSCQSLIALSWSLFVCLLNLFKVGYNNYLQRKINK